MAALISQSSRYEDFTPGTGFKLGVHLVTLQSASDTFKVPALANSTSAASVKGVAIQGQTLPTIANSDAFTVTLVGGAAGDVVRLVTLHQGMGNAAQTQ
jgi:hypothetical protein